MGGQWSILSMSHLSLAWIEATAYANSLDFRPTCMLAPSKPEATGPLLGSFYGVKVYSDDLAQWHAVEWGIHVFKQPVATIITDAQKGVAWHLPFWTLGRGIWSRKHPELCCWHTHCHPDLDLGYGHYWLPAWQ